MSKVITGQVWTGYIGECKKDERSPLFVIQNPDDFEEDEENAVFICDILKKYFGKKVSITIEVLNEKEKCGRVDK